MCRYGRRSSLGLVRAALQIYASWRDALTDTVRRGLEGLGECFASTLVGVGHPLGEVGRDWSVDDISDLARAG